jgi:hypothetical protein
LRVFSQAPRRACSADRAAIAAIDGRAYEYHRVGYDLGENGRTPEWHRANPNGKGVGSLFS